MPRVRAFYGFLRRISGQMSIIRTQPKRPKKRKLRAYERRVVISGQVSAKVVERLRRGGVKIVQGPA